MTAVPAHQRIFEFCTNGYLKSSTNCFFFVKMLRAAQHPSTVALQLLRSRHCYPVQCTCDPTNVPMQPNLYLFPPPAVPPRPIRVHTILLVSTLSGVETQHVSFPVRATHVAAHSCAQRCIFRTRTAANTEPPTEPPTYTVNCVTT